MVATASAFSRDDRIQHDHSPRSHNEDRARRARGIRRSATPAAINGPSARSAPATYPSALTLRLFAATPIAATDQVLDVGCGCGNTTRVAAKRAIDGTTLGVDLSEPMLAQARVRANQQGLTNVRYQRADVQTHDLGASRFD